MSLLIVLLILILGLVAMWLLHKLPNKFFQLVVGTIAVIFGVTVGISSGESSAYRNAAAACFLCVIGFFLLIRAVDWFLSRFDKDKKSLFDRKEKEQIKIS